ncbi:hypothetical protein NXX53_14290 [Bacteroides salyersiae]|nr:hypothetical protein [Bacteroides salyersiae]
MGDFSVTTNYRFDSIPKRQVVVNTINPHSWVTSHRDTEFKKALLQSDALIPDGTRHCIRRPLAFRNTYPQNGRCRPSPARTSATR